MMTNEIKTQGFRVPNSIVQAFTTTPAIIADGDALNRMSAFVAVVLLGLFPLIDSKRPTREVKTKPSELLSIIEVSKNVAHAVEREWGVDECQNHRRYETLRFSPAYLIKIHEALQTLANKSVLLQKWDMRTNTKHADRLVHILDSFGYDYVQGGRPLDLDDLPVGIGKVNVGTDDRPIWRLKSQTERGPRYAKASSISFRLNTELAEELKSTHGTIGFTIFARKVFKLFRKHMRSPAMIRLIILVLRQTGEDFSRQLDKLLPDLGFDTTHPERAIADLVGALDEIKTEGLVNDFTILHDCGSIKIHINRLWSTELPQIGGDR